MCGGECHQVNSQSHRSPANKVIHWVAVPVIYATVMGLLWAIPQPAVMAGIPWLNWAVVALVPTLLFYLLMSFILRWWRYHPWLASGQRL